MLGNIFKPKHLESSLKISLSSNVEIEEKCIKALDSMSISYSTKVEYRQ